MNKDILKIMIACLGCFSSIFIVGYIKNIRPMTSATKKLTDFLIEYFTEKGEIELAEWLKERPQPNFVLKCDTSCGTMVEDYEQGERCVICPKKSKNVLK